MTIYFPDISSFDTGISLKGALAVACKATEGTSYINGDYAAAKGRAAQTGTFFMAYHFLHAGNAGAQATHAFGIVGKGTPLMLDFEPTTGSSPTLADAEVFIDTYRKLGGIVNLVYLPHWYWSEMSVAAAEVPLRSAEHSPELHEAGLRQGFQFEGLGSPSLNGLVTRHMHLWSSQYTGYSDSGPGWAAYGGMAPAIWQYTDSVPFNGFTVDFSAFRGTLAELESMAKGVTSKPWTPASWAYVEPRKLTARGGRSTVALSWESPRETIPAWAGTTEVPYPASYTVEILYASNRKVQQTRVTSDYDTSVQIGSIPKGQWIARVWANGGPSAPSGAEARFATSA